MRIPGNQANSVGRRHLPPIQAALLLASLAAAFGCSGSSGPPVLGDPSGANAMLLIGNTRGDNVVLFEQESSLYAGEFIKTGSGGLHAPDFMLFGPDGNLYITSGDTALTSAVLRYRGRTGQFMNTFTSGGGLLRPYGMAFGPDGRLYVASFLTDQIIRYNADTGVFVNVFATSSGMPGGLNGPDALLFGPDGKLYVTTQGSVAVNGQATFPGLPSQVLQYDIETGDSTVFIDQPAPSMAGHGFVSLLGLAFGPDCDAGDCDLFVSDYANDIRRYDATTGQLKSVIATSYSGIPSMNFLGSLAFGDNGALFTVGFDSDDTTAQLGTILRFDAATGDPLPSEGQSGAIFVPEDARLKRPIGITARPATSP
jgi:glucose/arabinose dehydrogenase